VLKTSSWCISVLIQTKRRIDRRCTHSDRRSIRCYWLCCFFSAIHPAHLGKGLSVHPTVSTSFCLLRSVPSASTLAPMVPSVHPTVCFLFLSLHSFDPRKIDYLLNLACGILVALGPRNVYKDMLNNMVSPIDHVVMNHQNQSRTNQTPSLLLTTDAAAPTPSPRSWCWEGGGFGPRADGAPACPRLEHWREAELSACCAAAASSSAFSCWRTRRSLEVASSGQPRSSMAVAAWF
jgi:hypothetical protein